MNTGKISKIERDGQLKGVILSLERSDQKEDKLTFTLPQSLVGGGDPRKYNFTILVNGNEVSYNRTHDDVETGFEIPLTPTQQRFRFLPRQALQIIPVNHKTNPAKTYQL